MNTFILLLPGLLAVLGIVTVVAAIGYVLAQKRVPITGLVGIAAVVAVLHVLVFAEGWISSERGGDHRQSDTVWFVVGVLAVLAWIAGTGHAAGTVYFHRRAHGLVTMAPLVSYLLILCAAWALLSVGHAYLPPSAHGDDALIANFFLHEEAFDQIATMVEQEGRPITICAASGESGSRLPDERLARYRAPLQEAGIRYGVTRDYRNETRLIFWGILGDSNSEKGYAFRRSQPTPLVASLDRKPPPLAYRHLKDSWYLYYHYTDSVRGSCM